MTEVTTGTPRCVKLQSNHQLKPPNKLTFSFYRLDAPAVAILIDSRFEVIVQHTPLNGYISPS